MVGKLLRDGQNKHFHVRNSKARGGGGGGGQLWANTAFEGS